MISNFGKLLVISLIAISFDYCYGHGFVFSKANEEMRDNIRIEINGDHIIIQYESVYLGQIAPHIRLMIDSNGDELITKQEVNEFFDIYKQSLNTALKNFDMYLDKNSVKLNFITAFAPSLPTDSLLAPFQIKMIFSATEFQLKKGENELVIDPVMLFEGGTHFLRLAKSYIEFSEDQEKAIGRFLQVSVYGSKHIKLTSTYPGRLKNQGEMAYIYGVFYDKTPLDSKSKDYPKIKITFLIS